MHLYLTGFMGSGKTSVGEALSLRLQWRFIDLDEGIQQRTGMTVSEIFERLGEVEFRRLESEALEAISEDEPTVVATGGGTVVDPGNRRVMQSRGLVVWLNAPLDLILKRVGKQESTRPLLGEREEMERLFADRVDLYRLSDCELPIDSDSTIEQVADSLEALLESSS